MARRLSRVRRRDGGRSAQFEHTLLVTESGVEAFTGRLPTSNSFFWELDGSAPAKADLIATPGEADVSAAAPAGSPQPPSATKSTTRGFSSTSSNAKKQAAAKRVVDKKKQKRKK